MIKKALVLLSIFLVLMAGCSKPSPDRTGEDSDVIEALESRIVELESENDELRKSLTYYSEQAVSPDNEFASTQTDRSALETDYQCSEKVLNSSPADGFVQVDDVVFGIGCSETLADVVSAFEEKGYMSDFFAQQEGRTVKTTIYKDDMPYIVLEAMSVNLWPIEEAEKITVYSGFPTIYWSDYVSNMLVTKISPMDAAKHNMFFFNGYRADGSNLSLEQTYNEISEIADNSSMVSLSEVSGGEEYTFSCTARIIPINDPYPEGLLGYVSDAHDVTYSFRFSKKEQTGVEIVLSYYGEDGPMDDEIRKKVFKEYLYEHD